MSSDPAIERVARALCAADGRDPDQQVDTGHMVSVRTSPNTISHQPETVPAWTKRIDEARRFVAAFRAMGGADGNPT